jgi:glycosyltransferase involved in cell wall biosynthesis
LKILEAFAAGLPVVSTAVGAEGIAAADGVEIVLAERPAMADAILRVLTDEEYGRRLAAAARSLSRNVYDWPAVGAACTAALNQVARSTVPETHTSHSH